MFDFVAKSSTYALAGITLLAAACAPMNSASYNSSTDGRISTVDALGESNTAVYSNPVFTKSAEPAVRDGFSGSTLPPREGPLFTGTEYYPVGANGPEAPGSQATGSTMGQMGGF